MATEQQTDRGQVRIEVTDKFLGYFAQSIPSTLVKDGKGNGPRLDLRLGIRP